MNFLCSYRPIIGTKQGRKAIEKYRIKKYVDGSCRREPDFENPYPSITSLCRFTKFAPRLNVSDKVVYITKKGKYEEYLESHWRITAILQIKFRFNTHKEASDWYQSKNIELPRNCMVVENQPHALDKTDGVMPNELKSRRQRLGDDKILRLWDAAYQNRANKCGIFLACIPIFLNLTNPPILSHDEMLNIFGKVPSTQNPPKITDAEFEKFEKIIRQKNGI
jgi:hypothetical protein